MTDHLYGPLDAVVSALREEIEDDRATLALIEAYLASQRDMGFWLKTRLVFDGVPPERLPLCEQLFASRFAYERGVMLTVALRSVKERRVKRRGLLARELPLPGDGTVYMRVLREQGLTTHSLNRIVDAAHRAAQAVGLPALPEVIPVAFEAPNATEQITCPFCSMPYGVRESATHCRCNNCFAIFPVPSTPVSDVTVGEAGQGV